MKISENLASSWIDAGGTELFHMIHSADALSEYQSNTVVPFVAGIMGVFSLTCALGTSSS
jgi:hypothetical protein